MSVIFVDPSNAVKTEIERFGFEEDISILDVNFDSKGNTSYKLDLSKQSSCSFKGAFNYLEFLRFTESRLGKDNLINFRWEGCKSNLIDSRSNDLSELLHICNLLNCKKYSRAIFFTPVYHHRHTFFIDIVCDFLNIARIYLYPNQIDGRLLPLIINKGGIESRRVMQIRNFHDYDVSSLDDFISRSHASLKVETYEKDNLESSLYKSFTLSCMFVFYRAVKAFLSNINSLKYYSQLGVFGELRLLARQYIFIKEYINSTRYPLLNFNFNNSIVVAAHTQPEASSVPEGGFVKSHIDLVTLFRESGYVGDLLYKEHPASFRYFDKYVGPTKAGMYRFQGYLTSLKNLGVKLIETDCNLLLPKDGCYPLVATMTGTIALERALLGLRTIVTGHPWFVECPGIIFIGDFDFSQDAIPSEWLVPDPVLANEARLFILNCLSLSGFANPEGIGNLHPYNDSSAHSEFFKSLMLICKSSL